METNFSTDMFVCGKHQAGKNNMRGVNVLHCVWVDQLILYACQTNIYI